MLSISAPLKIFLITFLLALAGLAQGYAQTSAKDTGPFSCPAPTALTPVWGKLVINENTVTAYYGTGLTLPATWTQMGLPQTIGFINNPLLVGIFISSHNTGALGSGTIDNFSITPKPTYELQDRDVGSPVLMGCANLLSGVWNISGCGADIWGTADQCNFQPWLVWGGTCTVICRVTSLSTGDPWQKIGIMVRDGFNSGSDFAMFCATHAEGVDYQYRTAFNDNGDLIKYVAPPAPGVVSGISIGMGLTGNFLGPYLLHP